eukprot:6281357-Alexandrium_andersonii.AAC.1
MPPALVPATRQRPQRRWLLHGVPAHTSFRAEVLQGLQPNVTHSQGSECPHGLPGFMQVGRNYSGPSTHSGPSAQSRFRALSPFPRGLKPSS